MHILVVLAARVTPPAGRFLKTLSILLFIWHFECNGDNRRMCFFIGSQSTPSSWKDLQIGHVRMHAKRKARVAPQMLNSSTGVKSKAEIIVVIVRMNKDALLESVPCRVQRAKSQLS